MTDTTIAAERNSFRECPRCAEPVAQDLPACACCGHEMRPLKSVAQRLADIAALVGGLALVIGLCLLVSRLTGV